MLDVKPVKIKNLTLDGKHIYVQSMLNVPANDVVGSVKQAKELEVAGCEIIRAAIPDESALSLIPAIKSEVAIPLVADIHYDYRLAIGAAERGIDKIRINPGNIGGRDKVKAVADCCRSRGIPIRIGVNSGSLEKDLLKKYGSPTAEALCESAMRHVRLLEECDFDDIVVSIKSSDVRTNIAAYRLMRQMCSYPLHLGVTEAGTYNMGIIKSSIAIGSLLCDGIGETIRVSLTDDPLREVEAGINILKAVGMRAGVKIVSCPTCGRTKIDLIGLANRVESALKGVDKDITVAVMGCVVNGPGEAKEADIGLAGGDGCAVIFKKDKIIGKFSEEDAFDALLGEIQKL
ncbi:MAG TPA: flavodoxin-dependent (E)-4-hydroxy-3-methylbut-2-enyl-diphosphate synthase [Candidatus Faeciplasma gallinarum]|uniref:4-hydroxy-3-methylbut-2-en-1-yl diphosphate synthase (flavodoxin) n=1 Tax=Candidatus Faeciplasma gallinarum TaxID=2840799 RepID=A0A9D1JI54_9FIRM|nr:flavodoxin-dependent (E)-4-hydroxy-3-methylbut-2-enyl-diphosphate synthase [Candidatus Faeciplasma gallinarum]